jgi:hypothetical protein
MQYSLKEQTEFTILTKFLDPLVSNIMDSLTKTAVLFPFTCMWWFAQWWCSSPLETLRGREYSLKQHTQFTMLKMVLNHLASNINDFHRRATEFLLSHWRGCFAQGWYSSHMKTLTGRQHSFQSLTQFTMPNKVQDPFACNINVLLQELQCFSHSLEWRDSAQRWCCTSRKTLRGRQYSFKEQTEFTILTKLAEPLVSNKDSL